MGNVLLLLRPDPAAIREGAEIWAYDGGNWHLEVANGLDDKNNFLIHVLRRIGGRAWAGTQNLLQASVLVQE
ncbi:MAG: hypothetical protein AB1640_17870 [bacterium]